MGEVYRAHDSRLNRDVAINASNCQFTERFTPEGAGVYLTEFARREGESRSAAATKSIKDYSLRPRCA
jgi:hypothetical protein